MGLSRLSVMKNAEAVKAVPHFAFVDAAIAKKKFSETTIDMADYVIGLGPGFTAGVDVDVVIETKRGHRLGRIIREGQAIANTGIPGYYRRLWQRACHSFRECRCFPWYCPYRRSGEKWAISSRRFDDAPVYATLDGVLRGILRDGLPGTGAFLRLRILIHVLSEKRELLYYFR